MSHWRKLLFISLISFGLLNIPVGTQTVSAVGVIEPSVEITANGSVLTNAVDSSTFTTTVNAPITINGQTSQTITTTWDKTEFTFASNVTVPEGWTVQYTVDGTTWTNTAPANLATVQGLRTTGNVASVGFANGLQTSVSSGPSTIKQQTVGSLSVTGGGDGYDVFFDEAYTKIFNVWHHSYPRAIDCHSLFDGTRCSGYPVTMPTVSGVNLGTTERSTGISVGDKVWIGVGYGTSPGGGFVCVKVSGGLCSTSFVSLTNNVYTDASDNYGNVGNMARVGQYVFTQNFKDGNVLCLDTATEAGCSSMPTNGFDLGLGATPKYPSNMVSIGTRLYVNAGNGKVGCLDTTTWGACTGWSTPWNVTKTHYVFALPNSSGDIVAVCMFDTNSAECVTEAKVSYTGSLVTSINNARAAVPEWAVNSPSLYGYTNGPQTVGSRVYWINMVWDITHSGAKNTCWDASLNSGAGDICTFSANGGANYFSDQAYAMVVDPTNANCLWTNDNNGNIQSFNAQTGGANCPVPQDAVVEIPYNVAAPRFSCSETGRIRQWDNIDLNGTNITMSSLKLTVKKSGLALTNWINKPVDSNGIVDLSSLQVSQSGTRPTFEITGPGLTSVQAATITGSVKYLSDPPQMCLNLTPIIYCPTGTGVAPNTTLQRPDDVVSAVVTNSATGTNQEFTKTQSVTRSSVTGCTGAVNGNVSRTTGSGNVAIPNATVQLRDSNNTVVATATTNSSGNYSFPILYPHAYSVTYVSNAQASTVTANATTTKNFVVSVNPPTASPISASSAQNMASTLAIVTTTDALTSIDNTTLVIKGSAGTWGTSVVVANEGTWTVGSNGQLVFTPLPTFTGTTTPIDYRVADGFTVTAQSTASVTVTASPISASPDSESGTEGQTLQLKANADAGSVPIQTGSVKLRADDTSVFTRVLSIPDVGTFTGSLTTNDVSFVPASGWTGIKAISYQVTDLSGRTVTSTLTVTISPLASPSVLLRNGRKGATITWTPSPTSSVRSYEVLMDGKVLCTVSAENRLCNYPRPIGNASRIAVKAFGNDKTYSPVTPAVMRKECSQITSIYFATDSARITLKQEKKLQRIARLIKQQKFSGICIIGNTDFRNSFLYNNSLSYFRANNAYEHLKAYLPGNISATLDYAGEFRPIASNKTKQGMKMNRRVDIGVRP